jgi:hypothetical protein
MTDNINTYRKISGPLLKKIINDLEANAEVMLTPAGCKRFMYAGHNSTISNLLSAKKVWDPQISDYVIMILVEMHQNKIGLRGIKVTELTTTTLTLIYLKIS